MATEYVELVMSSPNGELPFHANPSHVAAVYDTAAGATTCNLTTDNGFTYVILGSAAEVIAKLNGSFAYSQAVDAAKANAQTEGDEYPEVAPE